MLFCVNKLKGSMWEYLGERFYVLIRVKNFLGEFFVLV